MIELTPETSVTLAFEGELESHNWEQFRDAIIDAVVDGTTVVVLDLSDVTFFDSSAVRALLGARLVLEPWHVTIAIGPCSEMARRVPGRHRSLGGLPDTDGLIPWRRSTPGPPTICRRVTWAAGAITTPTAAGSIGALRRSRAAGPSP